MVSGTDTGLTASTTCSYAAAAVDGSGHVGAQSSYYAIAGGQC